MLKGWAVVAKSCYLLDEEGLHEARILYFNTYLPVGFEVARLKPMHFTMIPSCDPKENC